MIRRLARKPRIVFLLTFLFLIPLLASVPGWGEELNKRSRTSDRDKGQKPNELEDATVRASGRDVDEAREKGRAGACSDGEMESYHGKCISADEKAALIEIEIRHVEMLISKALSLYQSPSPEVVAMTFKQTSDFLDTFEADAAIDDRIEKNILLLLGFLYGPTVEAAKELKSVVETSAVDEGSLAFLDALKRLDDFRAQVQIPLMRLLGEKLDAYEVRNGRKEFERLMVDNGLGHILEELR